MAQPQPRVEPDEDRLDRSGGPSDPEAVRGKKERAVQREAKRLNGLRRVMNDPESRLWLWDLLSFCGINRTSFTGNSTTFFNEGQRNVGLRVQADLTKHFPKEFIDLLKEGEAQNA